MDKNSNHESFRLKKRLDFSILTMMILNNMITKGKWMLKKKKKFLKD